MCLFELRFSQRIFPVEGFLGQMVVLFLVSEGTSILFSTVTVSMYIPSNSFVFNKVYSLYMGFYGGSDGKESACHAGELRLIPGLERSAGGGHGNPLQPLFLP